MDLVLLHAKVPKPPVRSIYYCFPTNQHMRKAWLNCWLNTVETAGTYQLNWNAYINFDPAANSSAHQFNLKVNGITVAVSYNHSASTGFQPAVISALLPLDAGDNVGIFAHRGKLYQSATFKTRFFGILFDEIPSADE